MFKNILKAEFYKFYSSKANIITIICFIAVTLLLSALTTSAIVDSDNMYSNTYFMIVTVLSIVLFFYTITFLIIPVIFMYNVFCQDFSNNVIASTIAAGTKRTHIFIAKSIVICSLFLVFSLIMIFGVFLTLFLIYITDPNVYSESLNFIRNSTYQLDMFFLAMTENLYVTKTDIMFNIISKYTFIVSMVIVSSVIARRIVKAIVLSLLINFCISILKTIIETSSTFNNLKLNVQGFVQYTTLTNLLASVIMITIAFFIFYRSEY